MIMTAFEEKHLNRAFNILHTKHKKNVISGFTLVSLSSEYFKLEMRARDFKFDKHLRTDILKYLDKVTNA